jgi:hypothetical protein
MGADVERPATIRGLDALAFLAELVLVAAAALVGWVLGSSVLVSLLLAVALPAVVVVVWGRWLAPRSPRRVSPVARWRLQLLLLLAVGLLGATAGGMRWLPPLLLAPLAVFAAVFARDRS